MDDNKKLAIELAKALIQNNNVKPVSGTGNNRDESRSITYIIGDSNFSFFEIASHFLDNIKNIEEYY
ncbi:hypothetical protein AB1K83_06895 [Sporosarcina sp. 179-K 3D1 HS]|uniref:hypothetical protein n=1 Tax=Sporosarcina sp. 179-K 3D1 HS TaxID=3232169 RepID=UPI00399F4696